MENRLLITPSPHIKGPNTVRGLMLDVIIALLPATLAGAYIFGMSAVITIVASVVSAVVSEALVEIAWKREVTIGDLSAVITGLLLALSLPPGVPIYVPIVGSAFAVIIAKQLFGGLGRNFVNPALAGRAFLLAAWPMHMTRSWINPLSRDAATGATPLASFNAASEAVPSLLDLLVGNRTGSIGETCIVALLLGGIYLIVRNVIDFRIPLGFLGTLFVGTVIFGKPGALFQGDGLSAMLLGGAVLGAFYMATDYVTSPVTRNGRLVMGIGAGFLTLLIRLWGAYPEGVTYGILMMNLLTPLIDRVIVPKPYGYMHEAKNARKGGR
jgi:electron transport complex protein RnfD